MNAKNLAKNVVKFAAIALGVFLLAQAVTAKSFYFSIGYSNYDYGYDNYIAYDSRPVYYEPAPAVVSYDYYYPPLTTYGTYYADAVYGYPYSGYYNTYSPYYDYYAPMYSCTYCYTYTAYPTYHYPTTYPAYFYYN